MTKDREKRFNELWEKQYEQGLRLTNQEYLEYQDIENEIHNEYQKQIFDEILESGDYRM